MEKEVFIEIKSTQFADGEKDVTELMTYGEYHKRRKKGCYKIAYDETEATGFEGNSVTLEIDGDNMVTLVREGSAASTLIIEKGKKHYCHYGTPFGDFMVGITADEIISSLSEIGGSLFMKYTIDINSSFLSVNEMEINIKTT